MRISALFFIPLMAGCLLAAELIRRPEGAVFVQDGSGKVEMVTSGWRIWIQDWPSTGLTAAAGFLLLHLFIGLRHAGIQPATDMTGYKRRRLLMTVTPFTAALVLGTGYVIASNMKLVLATAALTVCVATMGMVAAGSQIVRKDTILAKTPGILFFLLNAVPFGFAAVIIGSTL